MKILFESGLKIVIIHELISLTRRTRSSSVADHVNEHFTFFVRKKVTMLAVNSVLHVVE